MMAPFDKIPRSARSKNTKRRGSSDARSRSMRQKTPRNSSAPNGFILWGKVEVHHADLGRSRTSARAGCSVPPQSILMTLHDRRQPRIGSSWRFRWESLNELVLVAAQPVALIPDHQRLLVCMRQLFVQNFCSLNVCKNPFALPAGESLPR